MNLERGDGVYSTEPTKIMSSAKRTGNYFKINPNNTADQRIGDKTARKGLHYRFTQLICGMIILSILTNSTPAAPRTVYTAAAGFHQDVRFAILSGNFTANLSGLANNFLLFFSSSSKKQPLQLNKITILPGDMTINQGQPVNFSAVGYTANGSTEGGLKFDWTVQDTERNLTPRNLPNGTFRASVPGSFLVTAASGGVKAQVTIKVVENWGLATLKKLRAEELRGVLTNVNRLRALGRYKSENISSRKIYRRNNPASNLQEVEDSANISEENLIGEKAKGPNAGSMESLVPSAARGSRKMMRPIDEQGWNGDNWWTADDPGNQTGTPPGTSPDAGAGNGNFQFSAPVVALPGRGIDINLALNYNSRLWSKSGNQMSYDSDRGFPAPGWSFGFGKMMFMGTGGGCMIVDADGTRHGYNGTISNYTYGTSSSSSFSGHTADGTFIDYSCYYSSTSYGKSVSGSAKLSNGITISYNSSTVNGEQAFPTQISDAQGNYINITYRPGRSPEIQTVTDTMGRVVNFNYDSLNRLISVTVPKMDNAGARTAVRINYKQMTVTPGFAGTMTTDAADWNPYVIDSIYYPGTGTGYWFGDTDSYSSYGMIAKVLEQRAMNWAAGPSEQGSVTQGTMSKQAVYDYPLTPNYALTDAPTYSNLTESWAGMDDVPAVTNYVINYDANPRTITVTQPNGVKSKQISYNIASTSPDAWKDGLIYQDETLDGTNQLSKSVVTWDKGHYDSPRPTTTVTTDEKGQNLKTELTYGTNYNQVISQKQYDYNGTTLLRETRTTYENSSSYTNANTHIFNLIKAAEIYDGAGVRVSKTDYEYDNNAVVNGTQNHNLTETPGVTMHYSSFDPYTTELTDGACINGQYNHPQCTYQGETVWVYQGGWYEDICTYECTEYEQVTVYNPNSIFRGNVTKITGYADAVNLTGAIPQTKQYDATGNLVAESASCCQLKTYSYDDPNTTAIDTQYAYPIKQTRGSSDPNSTVKNSSSAVYDFNTGLVKQTTDQNGRTSVTQYNPEKLRPTVSTSSTGAYSQTTYDETAMTVTNKIFKANGTAAGESTNYLNGVGQVKKQESRGANNILDIVEAKYNKLGQIWKQSNPYRAGDTVLWTETIYDLLGRTKTTTAPDGSVTKAFYNEDATKKPDSVVSQTGNTIRVVDGWGRERWGRYDALERLAEVVEPNPNATATTSTNGSVLAAGSLLTKYTYNTLGDLTKTEQGIQVRELAYDSLGRMTRQKMAEQTATLNDAGVYVGANQTGAKWSESYIYDQRSNMTQKTDARGVKTAFVYGDASTGAEDPLNRLRVLYYDLSGPHDTSININAAYNISYDYMTTGDQDRIKKIESAGLIKEEYDYDPEGRVKELKQTVSGRELRPMTTNYLYDTLSRVEEVTYPAQYGLAGDPRKIIEHTYDNASRLSALKVGGQQQAGDLVFNAAGQTTSINIGTAGTNQVNENYTFDTQTGLLTNQKVQRGAQTLLDLSYEYNRNNSVGTLTGKTGHLSKIINNLDNNRNREYEYDALGRLTKAKGGDGGNLWQQQYTYDRYGNRTNVTATGVAADSSAIPSDGIPNLSYNTTTNRITSGDANGQFEYDAAGNQIRALDKNGQYWLRFDYDTANRISVIKRDDGTPIQAFQYSPSGGRLMNYDYATNQQTLYANTGGTTLAEYIEFTAQQPTWTKSYVYLGGGLLSTATSNGQGGENTEFNHPDRLGTRTITNQAAGTSSEQAALPFGTALNAESTRTNNPNRFTSYDRSNITGLDYAVNRSYDSKQGRFTQVDPIDMDAVDFDSPQTLNLYTYCGNDPINHTDPDGLFFGKLFKWIGKIFKVLRWVALAVAIVSVIALTAIAFAPMTSLVFKAAMWWTFKAMPFVAKYLGWAIGSTGTGSVFRTPSANPSGGGWGNFAFPGGTTVNGGVLAVVTVNIKWYERGVLGTIGTALEGFAESLTFGLPSAIDRWMGRDRGIDRNAPEYKVGEVVGTVSSLIIPGGTAVKGVQVAKGAKLGTKLFGRHKIGILNRNDSIRIGWSFKRSLSIVPPVTGKDVFRIAIGSKRGKIHWHITLYPW